MKRKAALPVILVLIISLFLFTACAGKTEEEIAEYIDEELGVIYTIFETTEGYYAKVSAVFVAESNLWATSITIPSEIIYQDSPCAVTAIGSLAFHKSGYDIIKISEGITHVESFAFVWADATSVELPSTVTDIGEYAFFNCMGLQELNLRAAVPPRLGEYAFMVYSKTASANVNSEILRINVPSKSLATYKDVNLYPQWQSYAGNLR